MFSATRDRLECRDTTRREAKRRASGRQLTRADACINGKSRPLTAILTAFSVPKNRACADRSECKSRTRLKRTEKNGPPNRVFEWSTFALRKIAIGSRRAKTPIRRTRRRSVNVRVRTVVGRITRKRATGPPLSRWAESLLVCDSPIGRCKRVHSLACDSFPQLILRTRLICEMRSKGFTVYHAAP